MRWSSALVSLMVLLALASTARAADDWLSRSTLRGIRRLWVGVDVDPVSASVGADSTTLINRLELRLRQNGIGVATSPPAPTLNMSLQGGRVGGENIIVLEISVLQGVFLARDPKMRSVAETWSVSLVQSFEGRDEDKMQNRIDALWERFLNAYLEANPKSRAEK
jgi:hypothetical protein